MSKINLEYVKHDFWTMVARDEVYERKLKCVFNIDKNGVTKRPPFNRSHSLGFKEPSNNPAQTAKKQSSRNGSITRSRAFCAMYRFDFLEFSIVFSHIIIIFFSIHPVKIREFTPPICKKGISLSHAFSNSSFIGRISGLEDNL